MAWTTTCQTTGCMSLPRCEGLCCMAWLSSIRVSILLDTASARQGSISCAAAAGARSGLLSALQRCSNSCCLLLVLPQIWHCSQDQSNHIVHEFFESDHFNDGIPIIPGVCGKLGASEHRKASSISIATSASGCCSPAGAMVATCACSTWQQQQAVKCLNNRGAAGYNTARPQLNALQHSRLRHALPCCSPIPIQHQRLACHLLYNYSSSQPRV